MYRNEINNERQQTHGNYSDNARISQQLKRYIHAEAVALNTNLTDEMQETIDMTCVKLSRIISGRPNEPDHWKDIAGYANLIWEPLEKKNEE